MVFCSNCGADVKNTAVQSSETLPELKTTQIMGSNSPLFDTDHSVLFIDWVFQNNLNAGIFDIKGQKLGEITRTLSEYGIDYALIDNITQESVILKHVAPTHTTILQNNTKKLGEIEKREVKSTLEVRPTPDTSDYFTELENFRTKKTIYNNNEEFQIAELNHPKSDEIPIKIKLINGYMLKMKHTGLNFRRLLALILEILIQHRSNPYH